MYTSKLNTKHVLLWRVLLTFLLIALAVGILVRNYHTLEDSVVVGRRAQFESLLLAVIGMAGTFFIAALQYHVLSFRRLRYGQTVLVELAAAFAGRLLPAGLGGLGLNGIYLYRSKHTPAEATVIVSVNNLIGLCAHLFVLAAVFIFSPNVVHGIRLDQYHGVVAPALGLISSATLVIVLTPSLRRKLASFSANLIQSLKREGVAKLFPALVVATLMTVTYTLILWCVQRSLGLHMGVVEVFIIFSIGMLVGTATPTPGGLVGTEAGLFGGFVAYGISMTHAGAAVLLFRLISYWLPIGPGLIALIIARKHLLV